MRRADLRDEEGRSEITNGEGRCGILSSFFFGGATYLLIELIECSWEVRALRSREVVKTTATRLSASIRTSESPRNRGLSMLAPTGPRERV